jgi:hypothetical protein
LAAAAVTILTEAVLLVQNVIIIRRTRGFFLLPDRFWPTTGVFLFLLGGGLVGNTYAGSFWPSTLAFLLFAGFFYLTGYVRSVLTWTRNGAFAG